MQDESKLKIDCAKLNVSIKQAESQIAQLKSQLAKQNALIEPGKARLVETARTEFEETRQRKREFIQKTCEEFRVNVDALLDSFPNLESQEYAGKYEVKELEDVLASLYPRALLEAYTCANPYEFETEAEAYQKYVWLEQQVTNLSGNGLTSSLFVTINKLLTAICENTGLGTKGVLVFVLAFGVAYWLSPYLFLDIFCGLGCASIVQGRQLKEVLRVLYSIKRFLNDTYDEDIFQDDKADVMSRVTDFLQEVEVQYIEDVDADEFQIPQDRVAAYEKECQHKCKQLENQIQVKSQEIENAKQELTSLLEQLDQVAAEKEKAAKEARATFLEKVSWEYKWADTMLLDVVDNRVLACTWSQANTLYYGEDLNQLQEFQRLIIYQNLLRVHPEFGAQVVIDYKYMGGPLVPFSRLPASLITFAVNAEDIDSRNAKIEADVRARCDNILRSSASIEEFNKLMATYDVNGETYMTVHIIGLQSFTPMLRTVLKNGVKVGYFFKFYLTVEELKALGSDIPFADIAEYAEVTDLVRNRTLGRVQELLAK